MVLGCAVFGVPALADYLVNIRHSLNAQTLILVKDYASPWSLAGYSVFSWSIFFCLVWVQFWAIHYLTRISPDLILRIIALFIGAYTEKVSKYVNFLRVLRKNIIFLLFTITTLITFNQTLTGTTQTDLFNFSNNSTVTDTGNNSSMASSSTNATASGSSALTGSNDGPTW